MELWIRSQDRNCLMKVNRADYSLSNSEHRIYVNGYGTLVGHYATKERALEVIDEIESMLCYKKYKSFTGEGIINIDNSTALYLMPEE